MASRSIAKDKKASLNRAIVSLESALTAYKKNLPKSSFDEVKSENQADAKRRKFRVAYATVILCYIYIEEWELAQKKVNDYDPYLYITKWDDRNFLDAVKEMYGFMLMAGKIMIMGGGDYDSDYRKRMDEFINNAKNIIDKKG